MFSKRKGETTTAVKKKGGKVQIKKRKIRTKKRQEGKPSIQVGWRYVHVDHLKQSMFCEYCKKPLSLQNICKETKVGVASNLSIVCQSCLTENSVSTSKTCQLPNSKKKHNEINSLMVLGAIHAGIGCTQLNKFLSTIGAPTMDFNLFKRQERIIGPIIELVAKESCIEATMQERQATIESLDELNKLM